MNKFLAVAVASCLLSFFMLHALDRPATDGSTDVEDAPVLPPASPVAASATLQSAMPPAYRQRTQPDGANAGPAAVQYTAPPLQSGIRQSGSAQSVILYGREQTILGVQRVQGENGAIDVLQVRDVASGQLGYWQPGLHFVLKPGNDYSAFLAEHRQMTRRFVNTEHAEVLVDVNHIAGQFNALANDPRVAHVTFLSLPAQARVK